MKKLEVFFALDAEEKRLVGELAESEGRIYFEYDGKFIEDSLWLSPFKLPLESGLHEHRDLGFGPLFGLFDDSLPDGWGLLLMDRYFRQQDVVPETISPLDRLAYMGSRTMGALTYHPPAQQEGSDTQIINLHHMAEASYQLLEGKSKVVLPQLLRAGGSPGGARPKVLVGLNGDHMISGADLLPAGYTGWLIKFPYKKDAIDDGRIEYAYSQMAREAGIFMPETRLFSTEHGDAFFGVERFDRQQNYRRHVHTFGNLIHSNFRIPGCDYEQLHKVTRILTRNQTDVIAAFRMMVFNIAAHNRDDHVKNFAFMFDASNSWKLSPAYDLTFTHGPGGEHTMTVAGEGREPSRRHILKIAKDAGIDEPTATNIMDEVIAAVKNWPHYAENAGVENRSKQKIQKSIQACIKRVRS